MLKRSAIIVAAIMLVLAALLIPALFTKDRQPLVGPDLTSLDYEDVTFHNEELQLAGMLFVPEGEGPFPAAVIIHGSGTSNRSNKWYLPVTWHLRENGIAVFLPDKRGSEKSEGSWVGADLETLAGDTLAAVEYVGKQELFTPSGIGLVGMSQGGWIAPIAAAKDKNIEFAVSMSGTSVTAKQQLLHEEIHNISHFTWPFAARLLAPVTSRRILNMDHVQAYAGYDPMPWWNQVETPVFFAFGGGDENVPVKESVKVLKSHLDVDLVKVYPDGGHAIRDAETNRVQEEFLDDLVDFIRRSERR